MQQYIGNVSVKYLNNRQSVIEGYELIAKYALDHMTKDGTLLTKDLNCVDK